MKLLPLVFLTPVLALAQVSFPSPVLTSIHPLGGRPGDTVDLTVAGSDLDDLTGILLSPNPGAAVVAKPKLNAKGQPMPNTLSLALPAGLRPGTYELRVTAALGVSNPRVFQIAPQALAESSGNATTAETAQPLAPGQVAHGTFKSNAPHWFAIDGKKGQRLLAVFDGAAFAVRTRLNGTLHDAHGREIARLRDGLLDVTLPADGLYRLKIHDLMFGTGDAYGYRLCLTDGPVVWAAGEDRVYGWNLPGGQLIHNLRVRQGPPLERLTGETAADLAATSPLPPRTLPAETEDPATSPPATATALAIGQSHGGWFPAHGGWRRFDLPFQKGDRFIIEIESALADFPTDPVLLIENLKTQADGSETLTAQAEVNDVPALVPAPSVARVPLLDPSYAFEAKADGIFRISVSDPLNAANGRRHPYTLHVRPLDQPGTEGGIAMHATLPRAAVTGPHEVGSANVWRNGIAVIEVALPLRTASSPPLKLTCADLPPGLTCLGGFAGKGQRTAWLAFQAAADAPAGAVSLTLPLRSLHLNTAVRDSNRENLSLFTGGPLALAVVDQPAPARLELPAVIEVKADAKVDIPVKAHRHADCTEALTLRILGLGDPAKAPTVTLPAKADDAILTLDTKALGLSAGEYGFLLQGPAKQPVRRNAARIHAAEQAVQQAITSQATAKKSLESARADLAKATDPAARPAAEAAVKTAEQQLAKADKAKAAAEATVKDLLAQNPPKDAVFVVHSNPVRLRVQ
jgi:hypothetical protein